MTRRILAYGRLSQTGINSKRVQLATPALFMLHLSKHAEYRRRQRGNIPHRTIRLAAQYGVVIKWDSDTVTKRLGRVVVVVSRRKPSMKYIKTIYRV